MSAVSFDTLPLLLLLPLALLPLIIRRDDTLAYSWTSLLPADPIGRYAEWLWRALALVCLLSIIIGAAGPGRNDTYTEKIGKGAEISIVMDRSSSMDAKIRRGNNSKEAKAKELDKQLSWLQAKDTQSKNEVVRQSLSWLINQRPNNRYALTMFNSAAMRVTPFTDDIAIVQAALDASGIGRGPSKTYMGHGLLAAIEAFEGRSYSGSRVLMLVSDGGAKLDEETRKAVAEGLRRNRINLYFIYIESSPNSPNLESIGANPDTNSEEIALHLFFSQLGSQYQVFQAADPDSLAEAIQRIDEQQNLPLAYLERIPGTDYSRLFFIAAFVSCSLLLILSLTQRVNWI